MKWSMVFLAGSVVCGTAACGGGVKFATSEPDVALRLNGPEALNNSDPSQAIRCGVADAGDCVIDFGSVYTGRTERRILFIANESSDATLTLKSFNLDPGADGEFGVEGSITMPAAIGPMETKMIRVAYTPKANTAPDDAGSIEITSDDPKYPALTVRLMGTTNDNQPPVAVIAQNEYNVEPLANISMDGTQSYDPDGTIVQYRWTVDARPNGSTAQPTSSATSAFFVDLAGNYTLSLVVVDNLGAESEPATLTITCVPSQRFLVQMVWDTPGNDVDLHVVAPGGARGSLTQDCGYCNCSSSTQLYGPMDWGALGSDVDNPSLDRDDVDGFGPENISIKTPAAGVYDIYVLYYSGSVTTNVTVRMYLDGSLIDNAGQPREYTVQLNQTDDVWPVLRVEWPSQTVTAYNVSPVNQHIACGGSF